MIETNSCKDDAKVIKMIFGDEVEHVEGEEIDKYEIKTESAAVDVYTRNDTLRNVSEVVVHTSVEGQEDSLNNLVQQSKRYQGRLGVYMTVLNLHKIVNNELVEDAARNKMIRKELKKVTREEFYEWLDSRPRASIVKDKQTGRDIFLQKDSNRRLDMHKIED